MRPTLIREVQESGLEGVNMAVALTLAINADDKRFVVMKLPDIIRRSGFKKRAVMLALIWLKSHDYIKAFEACGRRAKGYKLNVVFGP